MILTSNTLKRPKSLSRRHLHALKSAHLTHANFALQKLNLHAPVRYVVKVHLAPAGELHFDLGFCPEDCNRVKVGERALNVFHVFDCLTVKLG